MARSYDSFSVCLSARWHLAIGDPTIAGWTVCALYAAAAATAIAVLRSAHFDQNHRRQSQAFWGMIAVVMAALALNKQLDLQSLLTALGRCLAQDQGWYENRRLVQRDFIIALAGLAALTGGALFWMLRGGLRQNLLPLLGLVALASFIVIRAGHFFHIFVTDQAAADFLLHLLTSALELLCPVLILVAGWHLLRPPALMPSR